MEINANDVMFFAVQLPLNQKIAHIDDKKGLSKGTTICSSSWTWHVWHLCHTGVSAIL